MPKQRSRDHLGDAEWGSHKDAIRKLYITENISLEGSDGVVEKMQKLYGFYKTPRQYQARFKEWGFRKNRRRTEWEIVARKIAARKEAGKESILYLEGKEFPQTILDKQTSRNSYDLAFKQYKQGPMPKTPKGFVLLTPIAEDREQFQTFNLPFMEFEATIRLKGITLTSQMDPHNINDVRYSHQISRYPSSGSFEFRSSSEEVVSLSESSQATELHYNTVKMHYSIIIPTLRSLLPTVALEEYSENDPRKLLPIETMREAHLKLLCFSVANNFAGTTGLSLGMIWDYLRNQISIPRLMELAPGPMTNALAEKLFNCAIESRDVQAVGYFLQKRYIDPNEQICIIENFPYTPIERSSRLQDIPMAKLLIHHKADVNKSYSKSMFGVGGALKYAVGTHENKSCADPVLVQLLLDSGADCNFDEFYTLMKTESTPVAEIIILKCMHDDYETCLENGIFHDVIRNFDSETATRIIQYLILLRANINYHLDDDDDDDDDDATPGSLLDTAAQRGYFELVQILLDYGASLTENTVIYAAISMNMDLERHLIDKGAGINGCLMVDGDYRTPYAEAIRNEDMDLIQLLRERGALCNITESTRFSAAVCAASEVGNLEILQSLILMGGTGHETDLSSALLAALKAGEEEAAALLIDAGVHIGGESLVEALKRKMEGLVRALLNAGGDFNFYTMGGAALGAAIALGDHSIIKDLIFAGADVNFGMGNSYLEKPLLVAIAKNDKELVKLLLAKGADVNDYSTTEDSALEVAIGTGDIDLVKFLLEEGAEPNNNEALLRATFGGTDLLNLLLAAFVKRYPCGRKGFGSEALAKAIIEDNGLLLEALLKVNADVSGFCWKSSINKTPLAFAIEKGDLSVVQRLLDTEVDPNDVIQTYSGRVVIGVTESRLTALLVAVRTKNPDMVQLLINRGADVNLAATRGVKFTPLQMAAAIGSLAIVQVLVRNGAEVDAPPAYNGGATALQWAAIGGFIGVAEELLKRGADVNAAPAKVHGRTALEGAAEHGRIDMVKFLLNAHAEFKGPGDRQYERAMKYARDKGHRALAEMLESYSQLRQNTQAG